MSDHWKKRPLGSRTENTDTLERYLAAFLVFLLTVVWTARIGTKHSVYLLSHTELFTSSLAKHVCHQCTLRAYCGMKVYLIILVKTLFTERRLKARPGSPTTLCVVDLEKVREDSCRGLTESQYQIELCRKFKDEAGDRAEW